MKPTNNYKWCWMMDYCLVNGLSPAIKDNWDSAELEYNKNGDLKIITS